MAERYIRRAALFDLQDELLIKAPDSDQIVRYNANIPDLGRPVPVLFGTRYISPVVVAWGATNSFSRSFYNPRTRTFGRDPTYITLDNDQVVRSVTRNIPVTIFSARMVLCLGGIDTVNRYNAGTPAETSATGGGDDPSVVPVNNVTLPPGYDPSVVSLHTPVPSVGSAAGGMFGGIFGDGGLGMPENFSNRFNYQSSYSHFWLSKGNLPRSPLKTITASMDGNQAYTGMTSLWFSNFNFGGKVPLPAWRVRATRIESLTTLDGSGDYFYQWRNNESIITEYPTDRVTQRTHAGSTMNPTHALREALTNTSWGAGIPEDQLDEQSFILCSQTCIRDGLDYCYLWNRLEPIDKLINSILDYIDAVLYYDPREGLYRVKVIRDDYVINAIPQFAEHNIQTLTNFKRQHGDESVNTVTITYHDYNRGANDAVTLIDQSGVNLAGQTIGASFSYEGCATKEAALRVAERELTALSQSLISFSIHVDDSYQTLGIGDAVNVSWQDMGITQLVMRILRIRHGDGTTAGVTLDLAQDVFADIHRFGEIVKPQDIEIVRPFFLLPSTVLTFFEQGYRDLPDPSTAFTNNPRARWLKIGRTGDFPDVEVTVDANQILWSIGKLLTPIPELTTDPRVQSFRIRVEFGATIASAILDNLYIRIDSELMRCRATRVSDQFYDLDILERAIEDSVAFEHYVNSEVVFLDRLYEESQEWDGSPLPIYLIQDIYYDRESVTPPIHFVGRGNLAPAPRYLKIRDQFVGHNIWVDGDLNIKWLDRARDGSNFDTGQQTRIKVTTGDSTITEQVFNVASTEQQYTLSGSIIQSIVGQQLGTIIVEVDTIWEKRESWAKWSVRIDWASYDRSSQRQGWNYDWGNNWGGGNSSGWGYNWDDDFSEPVT